MPIHTKQIRELTSGHFTLVSSGKSTTDNQWIKIAELDLSDTQDNSRTNITSLMVDVSGGTTHGGGSDLSFIVFIKYNPKESGSPKYWQLGTKLTCASLMYDDADGFNPADDLKLNVTSNTNFNAEVYLNVNVSGRVVQVLPLIKSERLSSEDRGQGFTVCTGQSWLASLPTNIDDSTSSSVSASTISGDWADQIVDTLTLANNVIKASDGGTAITLDTSSNVTLSAKLRVPQYIEHNGDTDTRINFSTADKMVLEAGGVEMISIAETTQNSVVVNDGGADVDFRVEGSSDANAFVVNGETNYVGIGTNTPGSDLEVYNAGVTEVRITGDNSGDTRLRIDNGSSNHYIFDDQSDSNNFKIEAASNKALCFNTNGANERMRISSGGFVGILTTNPTSALHVNGSSKITGTSVFNNHMQLHKAGNNSDPYFEIGTDNTNCLQILTNIQASSELLYSVDFKTKTTDDASADAGQFRFFVDETLTISIDDSGIDLESGKVLTGNVVGDVTGTASIATSVTVTANNSTNETVYLAFVDGTSGTQGIETDTGLTYNPSTNFLTLAGDLRVGGSSIFGPADNFLALHSDTDMYFDIDEDADSTSLFYFRTGNTNVMTLDEAGTMSLKGRLHGMEGDMYIAYDSSGACPQIRFDNSEKLRLLTQGNSGASMKYGITLHAQTANVDPYIGYRNDSPILPHDFDGSASFNSRVHIGGQVDPTPINTLAISLSMADADNGILLYRNDSTVVAGNVLGGIGFDSTDGNLPSNTWEASAAIIAYSAETQGTGDKGGYLTFRTAPIDQDDDTSSIERLRIEEDGKVYVLGANAYSSAASGDGTLIVVQNADTVDDGLVIYNTGLGRAFRFWVGNDNESNIFAGSSGNAPINISARPLRLLNGTDVSGTADSGFLILGDTAGTHMSIDSNEIQVKKATNDPAGTRLYLQALGGDVFIHRPNSDPGTALHVINEDEEDSILPTCYIQSNASDGANDSVILGLNYATIAATGADSGDVHIDFQVNETTQGQIYASGTTVVYSAFTGVHISGIDPSRKEEFMTKGLIVSSDGSKKLEHVSEAVTGCKISSHAKDKAVYGVVSRTPFDPTISKWDGFVEGDLAIHVNSVGNGMVWVTDITGNIECGDFICSSDIAGYGQLQDDDILRNYTVAKCTESVDWSQISETIDHDGQTFKKCLIACTYHCG